MATRIDRLTEDDPIANQQFVCLSFVSPEGIKGCKIRALKIRGVFSTIEEAKARAQHLQSIDPIHHIFVGEVGKWLPWDPEPSNAKDQVYYEKELNNLMKGHEENMSRAKEVEAKRKQDLLEKSAKTNATKDRLRKKLKSRRTDSIDESSSDPIGDHTQTLEEIDANLAKISEMLKK